MVQHLSPNMTLAEARKLGRYGDTELVHLNKHEVAALESLTPGQGMTTNPVTGEKEAWLQFLPAILSTIATVGGSLIGANQARNAQNRQNAIQESQLAAQKEMSQEQIALAKEGLHLSKAGEHTPDGSYTYDPATNSWQVKLSPRAQYTQTLGDIETNRQLTTDATTARTERDQAAMRRGREGGIADSLLFALQRKLGGQGAVDPNSLAAALSLSRRDAVNNSFDSVGANLATQALRTGGGIERIGGELGRARARAYSEVMGSPQIEAMQMAQDMNNADIGMASDLYGAMASRAANINDMTVAPPQVGQALAGAMSGARNVGVNAPIAGAGVIGNAAAGLRQANTMGPDYTRGAGQTSAAIGNLIGSLFSNNDIGSFFSNLNRNRGVSGGSRLPSGPGSARVGVY